MCISIYIYDLTEESPNESDLPSPPSQVPAILHTFNGIFYRSLTIKEKYLTNGIELMIVNQLDKLTWNVRFDNCLYSHLFKSPNSQILR